MTSCLGQTVKRKVIKKKILLRNKLSKKSLAWNKVSNLFLILSFLNSSIKRTLRQCYIKIEQQVTRVKIRLLPLKMTIEFQLLVQLLISQFVLVRKPAHLYYMTIINIERTFC